MEWYEAYGPQAAPGDGDIAKLVGRNEWEMLNLHLQQTYGVEPRLVFSNCSMQRGWNVKYKKSGKSLCTLYPMEGYFIALVVVGPKESGEAELLVPLLSPYSRELFGHTAPHQGSRWLMMEVKEEAVLRDVQALIALRVKCK